CTYNQVAPQNRASNYMAPPGFAPMQNGQNRFNQNSIQQGALPSNTIPNLKGEMKAITTRSGVAYEGPSIPTPKKVVEQETEEIADKEQSNFQINISFAGALLLTPKFASTIKSLLTNKDKLFELAKIPLNENCSAMLLKKLLEKLGDPELADRSITRPKGVVEDVFVKVVNRIDIIDVAREEYAQEILGFSSNSSGGNPTSTFKPILSDSSLSLTPFEESDFILEEIEAYLKDDSVSPEINHANFDPEGDICLIEKLLNDDPLQLPLKGPPEVELKDLPPHLEYAYLEENDK
nr:reverse transcriptase domain-containing protein [Tanacetum cinerariifolium]